MAVENLHGFLNPNDAVAISFWIISISMVAATVFFLMESMAVSNHWKTSMNVGALVTLGSSALLLHARILGHHPQLSHPLSLHRLVDYSSLADDRVQFDPQSCEA